MCTHPFASPTLAPPPLPPHLIQTTFPLEHFLSLLPLQFVMSMKEVIFPSSCLLVLVLPLLYLMSTLSSVTVTFFLYVLERMSIWCFVQSWSNHLIFSSQLPWVLCLFFLSVSKSICHQLRKGPFHRDIPVNAYARTEN